MKHFCLLLFLLPTGLLHAQQRTLQGTVFVPDGLGNTNAAIFANVFVRGADSIQTRTDFDGRFSLSVPAHAAGNWLCVQYTGFASDSLPIDNRTEFNFKLKEGIICGDPIVVVWQPHNLQMVLPASPAPSAADDPLAALQGRVPGLLVARPGSNPNETYTLRFHGLSAQSGNNTPAIWLDGVPVSDLSMLHPSDIESVEVLPDLASAAQFGFGSAAGVIRVTTKKTNPSQGWHVGYEGGLLVANATRVPEVGTGSEFRQSPLVTDFGSETNWLDLVHRRGISQNHHVSVNGGSNRLSVRAGLGFADRQGILKNSQYQQLSGHVLLRSDLFNNKLHLYGRWAGTGRQVNYSFPDVFRYALNANPTLPVRDVNNPLFSQFDGYGQAQQFEQFNPVGILEQSLDLRERSSQLTALGAAWQLNQHWSLNTDWSYQSDTRSQGELYDPKGLWRNPSPNAGALVLTEETQSRLFGTAQARYQREFYPSRLRLDARASLFVQNVRFDGDEARGARIDKGVSAVNSLAEIQTTNSLDLAADIGFYDSLRLRNQLTGGLLEVSLQDLKRWAWGFNAGLRLEQEQHNKSARIFSPYASAFYNLNKFLKINKLQYLRLQSSWGRAANYCLEGQWAYRDEFTWGLNLQARNRRWASTLSQFYNTGRGYDLQQTTFFPPAFDVVGNNVKNQGWDLAFYGKLIQKKQFVWDLALNLSTLKSTVQDTNAVDFTSPGAPGNGEIFYHRSYQGARWGEIWGLEEASVADNGVVTFKDKKQQAGVGAPRWWLGLQNSLNWKAFRLDASVRGVFGHTLAHENRAFYEAYGQFTNRLVTPYSDPKYKVQMPYYNRFAEKAGFWRLDDLRLTWQIPVHRPWKLAVFVGGQNLLTSTDYTGNDPEVRIAGDRGPEATGSTPLYSKPNDPRAIGIDRRGTYWLEKSFYTGVRMGL